MNLTEMHQEFKVLSDKLDTASLPGFEPEEIDLLLNRAIERFIKQRYSSKGNTKFDGFEEDQKRIDDLRGVLTTQKLTPLILQGLNLYTIQLPDNYWFRIRVTLDINNITCSKTILNHKVRTIQHNSLTDAIDDPFNKPSIDDGAIITFEGSNILVYTANDFIPDALNITYIKRPTTLDINSTPLQVPDLTEETHREIIDIAVSMALEIIESQRYQSNLNELNKQE